MSLQPHGDPGDLSRSYPSCPKSDAGWLVGRHHPSQERRAFSRGVVSVQVALSIPVMLALIALAVYVGQFYRANVELLELVQEAARVCSRNLPAEQAEACARTRLEERAVQVRGCDEVETRIIVKSEREEYNDDDLAQQVTVSLEWLQVGVDCTGAFGLPFAGTDQFNLTAEAAMPMRLGDLVE